MKVETKRLGAGPVLDWLVAEAGGLVGIPMEDIRGRLDRANLILPNGEDWAPSSDYRQGGPILQAQDISVIRTDDDDFECEPWAARRGRSRRDKPEDGWGRPDLYAFYIQDGLFYGATPLIAGMRCFVTEKLGPIVTVPDMVYDIQRAANKAQSDADPMVQDVVDAVIKEFMEKYETFWAFHQDTVASLDASLGYTDNPDSPNSLDHKVWEARAKIENQLQIKASGRLADDSQKSQACAAIEEWFDLNISMGAALILWTEGPKDGEAKILKHLDTKKPWALRQSGG